MWNDIETTQDFLNFSVIAKTVAELIIESGEKPISIGVSGNWGAGKSSSFDAFNEGGTLQESVERFKEATGHYPERILADKLFRTRENPGYCKKHHIRLAGPKLGRPPKDKALYREQQHIEREESGEQSAVGCQFGVGKRRFILGCIMTRLKHSSEVSAHIAILTK